MRTHTQRSICNDLKINPSKGSQTGEQVACSSSLFPLQFQFPLLEVLANPVAGPQFPVQFFVLTGSQSSCYLLSFVYAHTSTLWGVRRSSIDGAEVERIALSAGGSVTLGVMVIGRGSVL